MRVLFVPYVKLYVLGFYLHAWISVNVQFITQWHYDYSHCNAERPHCVSRCLDEELISAVMGDTCGRGYFLTHGCQSRSVQLWPACCLGSFWAKQQANTVFESLFLFGLTDKQEHSKWAALQNQGLYIWQTVTSLLLNGVILLKRPRLKQREHIWLKYVCVGRLMSARFKCKSCCPIRASSTFLFISAETLHDGFFCWTLSKCCVSLHCRGVVTVQLPQRGTS